MMLQDAINSQGQKVQVEATITKIGQVQVNTKQTNQGTKTSNYQTCHLNDGQQEQIVRIWQGNSNLLHAGLVGSRQTFSISSYRDNQGQVRLSGFWQDPTPQQQGPMPQAQPQGPTTALVGQSQPALQQDLPTNITKVRDTAAMVAKDLVIADKIGLDIYWKWTRDILEFLETGKPPQLQDVNDYDNAPPWDGPTEEP